MPEPSEIISATIDRISNSGNGMVECEGDQDLNLGPVKPDAVGKEVEIEILSGAFDRCLDSSVVPDDYYKMVGLRSSEVPVTVTVDRVFDSGYGVVVLADEYLNLGPVTCSQGESVEVEWLTEGYAECLDEDVRDEGYDEWVKTITEDRDRFVLPVTVAEPDEEGDNPAELEDFNIKVGPLQCDAGEIVDVEILKSPEQKDETLAYCLNDELLAEGYEERMRDQIRDYIFDMLGSGDSTQVVTETIDRISRNNEGILEYNGEEYNMGPIKREAVGRSVEAILFGHRDAACLDKDAWGTDKFGRSNISWIIRQVQGAAHTSDAVRTVSGFVGVKRTAFEHDLKLSETQENPSSEMSLSTDSTAKETRNKSRQEDERPYSTQGSSNRSESGEKNLRDRESSEISQLRTKAERAASEDPERNVETSPGSRYVRSSEIKQYAKARADGYCEGCEKESPFSSKQGEPYLEVHHVDELGEGGSDSPDSVIALCPTCHSRVHYGEDGDKYNEELQEKVESELAEIGL